MSFRRIVIIILLCCFTPVVNAQETETGAVIESEEERILREKWEGRASLIEGFRSDIIKSRSSRDTFVKFAVDNWKRRADHRKQCRIDIKRSNRDTKMTNLLRCYRGQLSLDIEMLRKRKQQISQMPGVRNESRNQALDAVDDLIDASATVVQGIDRGVFETERDLKETKENIRTLYRDRYWTTLRALRTDTMRAWVAQLLTWIAKSVHEELPEGVPEKLVDAATCLEEQEELLSSVAGTRESQLRGCISLIHEARDLRDGVHDQTEPEEEVPEDPSQNPRRVRSIKL